MRAEVSCQPRDGLRVIGGDNRAEDLPARARQSEWRDQPIPSGQKLIHALVDTQGLPLRVFVHSAGVQDRDGAALVFDKIRNRSGRPKRAKMHGKQPVFRLESGCLKRGRGDFADFDGFIACNDCVQLQLAGMLTARRHNCTQ